MNMIPSGLLIPWKTFLIILMSIVQNKSNQFMQIRVMILVESENILETKISKIVFRTEISKQDVVK